MLFILFVPIPKLLCRKEQHWCCYCTLGPNHSGRIFSLSLFWEFKFLLWPCTLFILKTGSSIVCLLTIIIVCLLTISMFIEQCGRTRFIFVHFCLLYRSISWTHKFGIQSSPLFLVEFMELSNDLERYFYCLLSLHISHAF